jgi:peptide/nickel transport system substrate-binding protein
MSGSLLQRASIKRRRFVGAAAALAGSAALEACRGGAVRQGTAATNGAGQPRRGGRVSVGVTSDPVDFDPTYFGTATPGSYGLANVYEPLLRFKRGAEVKYSDLSIVPELAQTWESPDAQTYTFHLRPGVAFADLPPVNGRALTSADAQWSYEYLARIGEFADQHLPSNRFNWFFQDLERVEAPDPATVVMQFRKPFVPFLNYSALDFNPILPHEIYDQRGSFKDTMAGTGPWQLDQAGSQRGSHWSFKRNPTYWQAGQPYIDEVSWLVISDSASQVAAFVANQLDWVGNPAIGYPESLELRKQKPGARQITYTLAPLHLYLNLRVAPLNDVRVRQAISYAIDRDAFIRSFTGGQGAWALAGAFPETFSQDEIKQILHYDPQKAADLLKTAGFAAGLTIPVKFPATEFGSTYVSEVQLLQSQLKQVGITLELQNITAEERPMDTKGGNFQIIIIPKDLEGDVDSYLGGVFRTGAGYNFGGSSDPKLDALIDAEQTEPDPTKRLQMVREAVRYINETAQGLAIFTPPNFEFIQPRLNGYYPQAFVRQYPGPGSWLAA